jgi:hypothetical protein
MNVREGCPAEALRREGGLPCSRHELRLGKPAVISNCDK